MKQIAEQTGGEAFVGTNDLKLAMQRSMDDGSTYYTLAYTPDKIDPQTAFHQDRSEDQPARRQAGVPSWLLLAGHESDLTPAVALPPARRTAARHAASDHGVLLPPPCYRPTLRTKTCASSTSSIPIPSPLKTCPTTRSASCSIALPSLTTKKATKSAHASEHAWTERFKRPRTRR